MTRRKSKKPKYIYTSPDGGHTVYQQEFGSDIRVKISEDDYALSVLKAQGEEDMCGWEAVRIREQYPALQEAWDRYKTLWQLCVEQKDIDNTIKLKFTDE